MKKHILLALFLIATATSFAQSFYGGLILGGVTSQVEGDNRGGFHKAGFTGGAFVGLPLSDNFDIQMELKYIQKGSKSTNVEAFPEADPYLLKLDYIELPIVLGANFNFLSINGKPLKWLTFELGFSFDFLMYHREEVKGITNEGFDPWRRMCFNGVFGFRFNVLKNMDLSIRSINSINSIRTNVTPDSVTKYMRRYGKLGEFNDVLQLAIYWRL